MQIDAIRQWAETARRTPLDDGAALEAWHLLTPRCRFIKTLPPGASVLDMGAGDGSLQVYRRWPAPPRADLTMYAFALQASSAFADYDGWEVGRWPDTRPKFGGMMFDAIVAAHFIEHVWSPAWFIRWASERLTPQGRIYIEWPSAAALTAPTANELRNAGIEVMTGNYSDDPTHEQARPETAAVHAALQDWSLRIDEAGTVRVPWLEAHLMAIARPMTRPRERWPTGRTPDGANT
jgi:hypothetical protein